MEPAHAPVLVEAVLQYLRPRAGGVYVDCTVGAGGHAARLLEACGGRARLIGIDRDPEALARAGETLARFGDAVVLRHADFRDLDAVCDELGVAAADGFLFDLGISSLHVDRADRGFSYRFDAPLDMRMDPTRGPTAADLVNGLGERELARILRRYGEERWATRIARFIARERERRPLRSTGQLVAIIRDAIPASARRRGPHPARRTFQALRVAVNDELDALEAALEPAVRRLTAGGRVVAISFHSLEDRIVKRTFRRLARHEDGALLELLTRKPVPAPPEEVSGNPRARSARLRAAERCGT